MSFETLTKFMGQEFVFIFTVAMFLVTIITFTFSNLQKGPNYKKIKKILIWLTVLIAIMCLFSTICFIVYYDKSGKDDGSSEPISDASVTEDSESSESISDSSATSESSVSSVSEPFTSDTPNINSKPGTSSTTNPPESTEISVPISDSLSSDGSGWVSSSEVPYGAEIVDQKWKYTKSEIKESENANESGWTLTGSYWRTTESGTHSYATFPSNSNGYEYYNSSDQYYKKYNVGAYTNSETANAKREITDEQVTSYIYYHWVYPLAGSHSENDREIGEFNGKWIDNGGYANIWESFENGYIEYNSWTQAYEARGYSTYSYWWNGRIPVYTQTYTDYIKIYQYKRESRLESTIEITAGGDISNVQKLVRYCTE